ncbi:hypothetical protein F5X71_18940 [Nocardia brasiliensis]|uniref:DUF1579 domain-containing protein n=1 Tax=Nocardia brasiliensis TaxID=37326 RepID=A0A6G9XT89_NOCBR|nr:hypothetical protein F5X71_18940 [Nocardia brasiliensis]
MPDSRDAALDRLEPLVGRWQVEVSFAAGFFGPGTPAVTDRSGTTTFEWMKTKRFVIERSVIEHPAAPDTIVIIGLGQNATFVRHHYDSRGVSRTYQMTLDHGVLRTWRMEPGFSQQYSGTFSADGNQITGAWQKSADGLAWEHDFDLTYYRIGA